MARKIESMTLLSLIGACLIVSGCANEPGRDLMLAELISSSPNSDYYIHSVSSRHFTGLGSHKSELIISNYQYASEAFEWPRVSLVNHEGGCYAINWKSEQHLEILECFFPPVSYREGEVVVDGKAVKVEFTRVSSCHSLPESTLLLEENFCKRLGLKPF